MILDTRVQRSLNSTSQELVIEPNILTVIHLSSPVVVTVHCTAVKIFGSKIDTWLMKSNDSCACLYLATQMLAVDTPPVTVCVCYIPVTALKQTSRIQVYFCSSILTRSVSHHSLHNAPSSTQCKVYVRRAQPLFIPRSQCCLTT